MYLIQNINLSAFLSFTCIHKYIYLSKSKCLTPNADRILAPSNHIWLSKSEMKFSWFCFRNRSNTTDKQHYWKGGPWVDTEGFTGPRGQTPGCRGYPGLPLSSASCAGEKQKIRG